MKPQKVKWCESCKQWTQHNYYGKKWGYICTGYVEKPPMCKVCELPKDWCICGMELIASGVSTKCR